MNTYSLHVETKVLVTEDSRLGARKAFKLLVRNTVNEVHEISLDSSAHLEGFLFSIRDRKERKCVCIL